MKTQALEYTLVSNNLENDGNYMAKVIHQKTVEYEELLQEMERDTALRKEDIRLAISRFITSIRENLVRGLKVKTPLGVFRPSVRGRFATPAEEFKPMPGINNHELRIAFHADKELAEGVLSDIVVRKVVGNNVRYPKVFALRNESAPEDGLFMPTNVISVTGINLKIDTHAPDEGVFWTDAGGKTTKTETILRNSNSALLFQIPDLAPGLYTVSIAVRLRSRNLRSAVLKERIEIS
jgi:nucleoid DNA-binding protein